MKIFQHRVNQVEQLQRVPSNIGVEFDLRSDGDNVIITHDPFTSGPTIEEYFPHIGPRPCIFNIKCEGIEERVRKLAQKYSIEDYFFLDCSIPAAVKLVRQGEHRLAVRYSEFEPVEGVLAWKGKANWVWVDCFTKFPDDLVSWELISRHFQICLVSPELQGHARDTAFAIRAGLNNRVFHAVCSKNPEIWNLRS